MPETQIPGFIDKVIEAILGVMVLTMGYFLKKRDEKISTIEEKLETYATKEDMVYVRDKVDDIHKYLLEHKSTE